jgi:hypothetical protein
MTWSTGRGAAAPSYFRQWLALNDNELKWIAFVAAVCLAVGLALRV